jgi:hypothetical protein
MSGSVAPARRAGQPALAFGSLSAVGSFQKAAATEDGLVGIVGFLSEGLGTLAAQFLKTRTDRRKVVGSAWFGHVSSLHVGRASTRLEWLLSLLR